MALEDLQWELSELEHHFEENVKKHQSTIKEMRQEMKSLSRQLQTTKGNIPDRTKPSRDDAFVHQVEWVIDNFKSVYDSKSQNEAMFSDEFNIMGIPMQLEFFPKGRNSTKIEGFCALFLWCPKGVKLRYQLRVGAYRVAPDVDEYENKMGHGHSNFCNALAQRDEGADTLLVGVDILELRFIKEVAEVIQLTNPGLQSIVDKEAAVALHRHMNRVEWRIRNVHRLVESVPAGNALCSAPFSIAGLRNVHLEFYPNSVNSSSAGYCGLYINCIVGTKLTISFFVGNTKRGPITTEFDGHNAKGLPKFCKLDQELQPDMADLIVGVELENPELEADDKQRHLELE